MSNDAREPWKVIAEQASHEEDPARLLELTSRLNELLRLKEAEVKETALKQA